MIEQRWFIRPSVLLAAHNALARIDCSRINQSICSGATSHQVLRALQPILQQAKASPPARLRDAAAEPTSLMFQPD